MKGIFKWILSSNKVSILKTLLVNFKALPFSQALHLPIYIYTDTILESIGTIHIESNSISRGMIRIGRKNFFSGYKTQLINSGTIIFKGKFLIEAGTCINNCGRIVFGNECRIGEICKLLIIHYLEIGNCSRIAFDSVFMDTDFHSVVNTNTGRIKRAYSNIIIGSHNWIGNRCLIKKGTTTSSYTIVSAYSMLNKDYTSIPEYSLLVGCPAKVLASGLRRVYNESSNKLINGYFSNHTDAESLSIKEKEIINWDEFCLGKGCYLPF